MSRIGRKPIPLPAGVEVKIENNTVMVQGPRGELSRSFHPDMSIALKDGSIVVERPTDERIYRSLHGLIRTLISNMVEGVTSGFQKNLELSGVGYRAQKAEEKLVLSIGYSHPVEIVPPQGISLVVEGTNRVSVQGIDKELVGEIGARIRAVRPPEPYLGKGIRYAGERIRRKAGKAGKVGRRR